jgi:hypothetical protein
MKVSRIRTGQIAEAVTVMVDTCDRPNLADVATHRPVMLSRKPDPIPFYLKPGDKVKAIVAQIAVPEIEIICSVAEIQPQLLSDQGP